MDLEPGFCGNWICLSGDAAAGIPAGIRPSIWQVDRQMVGKGGGRIRTKLGQDAFRIQHPTFLGACAEEQHNVLPLQIPQRNASEKA